MTGEMKTGVNRNRDTTNKISNFFMALSLLLKKCVLSY
jgi:hypothetical protein